MMLAGGFAALPPQLPEPHVQCRGLMVEPPVQPSTMRSTILVIIGRLILIQIQTLCIQSCHLDVTSSNKQGD